MTAMVNRSKLFNRKFLILLVCLLLMLLLPPVSQLLDESYLISTMTRVLIFAMAAISLDLIVGYGAMVSFGHSAFLGLGAYVAAILSFHLNDGSGLFGLSTSYQGTEQLIPILMIAMLVAASVALITGMISLRTYGIHFIMITLAFAQMLYFLFVSLDYYGGDDGLLMSGRNQLPLIDTANDSAFYYLCLAFLVLFIVFGRRLVDSHFGRVLQGCKHNEQRMRALGFNTYRYRLTAYVIAAMGAAIAGVLLANKTEFVDPGLFSWQLSGELLVMVILGGLGSIYGAVIGAIAYLLLEQIFSAYTEHWMVLLGPVLIIVVIFARHGIYGMVQKKWSQNV